MFNYFFIFAAIIKSQKQSIHLNALLYHNITKNELKSPIPTIIANINCTALYFFINSTIRSEGIIPIIISIKNIKASIHGINAIFKIVVIITIVFSSKYNIILKLYHILHNYSSLKMFLVSVPKNTRYI